MNAIECYRAAVLAVLEERCMRAARNLAPGDAPMIQQVLDVATSAIVSTVLADAIEAIKRLEMPK